MLVLWTDKNGRTRERLIAKKGEIIKGRPFKKDDESFNGGVIFGDLANSLTHSLNADRLFEVEPLGDMVKILLQTDPTKTKKVRIFWIFNIERVIKERKVYGSLWKANKVRIMRELDVVPSLRLLAGSPDFWVRKAVAENPHTEPAVLQKLSADENGWVLAGVARNPNVDKEILSKLRHCSDPLVKIIAERRSRNPLARLFLSG